MIDDAIKKAIASYESVLSRADSLTYVQKEAERLAQSFRTIEATSAMKTLAENMANHEQMMRTILGPIEEFKQANAFNAAQLASQFSPMQSMLEDINKRFCLPEVS